MWYFFEVQVREVHEVFEYVNIEETHQGERNYHLTLVIAANKFIKQVVFSAKFERKKGSGEREGRCQRRRLLAC